MKNAGIGAGVNRIKAMAQEKDAYIRMVLVLTVMGIIAGGALSGFYHTVHPRILANAAEEERRAIFAVLEGIKTYDTIEKEVAGDKGVEKIKVFRGIDESGAIAGYAFLVKGPGFQGNITVMVGLRVDAKTLSAIKVIDQVETPGLGSKITEDKFTSQFRGLSIEPKIEYVKNKKPEKPNEIQAITGATISSRAVAEAINKRVKTVVAILKEPQAEARKEPNGR